MLPQIFTIARFTLLEASQARLPRLFLVALLLLTGMALFLGEISLIDASRTQIAFLAALLRPLAVFVLALFVISSLAREFQDKGTELLFSLPMPRAAYVIGKLAGFASLALPLCLLLALLLAWRAPAPAALAWGLALFCELLIVVGVSLFCALSFSQTLPALSFVLGFYLLARSLSTLLLIAHSPLNEASPLHAGLTGMLELLGLLLPDLARYTPTNWLLGAFSWGDLPPLLAQTAIYLLLLVSAAIIDLSRKRL